MKRLQGFIVGIVVGCILLTGIPVFATSISALFNSINIKINGVKVASIGESYTLQNGQKVPYSISYNGTTYLPLRKIGELLNKDVVWDGATKTASVSDKGYSSSNGNYKYLSYSPVLKIDGKLYFFVNINMPVMFTDENNKLYMDNTELIAILASCSNGSFTFTKSDNPYVAGNVFVKRTYTEKDTVLYLDINTPYTVGEISNSDGSKIYKYSFKPDEVKGGIIFDHNRLLSLNDILDFFQIKYNIEYDATNKLCIFSFE